MSLFSVNLLCFHWTVMEFFSLKIARCSCEKKFSCRVLYIFDVHSVKFNQADIDMFTYSNIYSRKWRWPILHCYDNVRVWNSLKEMTFYFCGSKRNTMPPFFSCIACLVVSYCFQNLKILFTEQNNKKYRVVLVKFGGGCFAMCVHF